MSKTVRFKIDPQNPPSLTEDQRAKLKALYERPTNEIDFSDIPSLDERFWENAVRSRFYKPTKTLTSVRLDSDVMAWLKKDGKGYQTRINAILREAMLRSLSPSENKQGR